MVAVAHVATNSLLRLRCTFFLNPVRFYGLQHKMTKDERHELAEYRRRVTELRKKFMDEWKEKEKMSQEAFSAQAAEAATLERHREQQALEDNKKELERMKVWRETKIAEKKELTEERRKKGEAMRKKKEGEKLQQKTAEVQLLINTIEDFITMENLDAKMEEIVQKETNYNYALKLSGEKIM